MNRVESILYHVLHLTYSCNDNLRPSTALEVLHIRYLFRRRVSESTVYRTPYYTIYCKLYSIPHSAEYSILGSAKIQSIH